MFQILVILLVTLFIIIGINYYFSKTPTLKIIPINGSAENAKAVKEKLDDLYKFVSAPKTSMLVLHKGKKVFEYGDITKASIIASCRKSVLSMLCGIYGINLDTTLADLKMDDLEGLTSEEKTANIRHLLTATSGIYHPASNGGDDTRFAPERGSKKPGEMHLYNNWDFNACGAAFEKITGMNIYDAFEEKLAIPLGMKDFDRSMHKKGGDLTKSKYPSYHFHLSARNMAKLGQLMLNNGKWGTKQLIPSAWVKESTQSHVHNKDMIEKHQKIDTPFDYGYLWWIYSDINKDDSKKGYMAIGAGGQKIRVFTELDVVLVYKVYHTERLSFDVLTDKVLSLF